MGYFTILHIIALSIMVVIFFLLFIIYLKETRKKIFWSMVFANFLVTTMLAIFSMFVLDKYTKKATIEGLNHKRVLLNENIVFSGKIRNIGSFGIGTCKLEVKLVNNAVSSKNLKGSSVFKPTSGLEFIGDGDGKPSTLKYTFVVAKDLKSGELRNFSVTMPYPSYFSNTTTYQKLYCH